AGERGDTPPRRAARRTASPGPRPARRTERRSAAPGFDHCISLPLASRHPAPERRSLPLPTGARHGVHAHGTAARSRPAAAGGAGSGDAPLADVDRLRAPWRRRRGGRGRIDRMAARIEDYALIGDCETAALVSRDGSVDWLCWPRFDSGACFAALLGGPENGRWQVAPVHPAPRITRRYREGTLILETDYETPEGAVTLIDFMPLRGEASDLVRIVVGKRGRVPMRTELMIRFDYGSTVPWVSRLDGALRAIAGPDMVVLRTDVPHHGEGLSTVGDFTVA